MTYDATQPWFGGLTREHLFADCPSRQRAMKNPNRVEFGWCAVTGMGADPDDTEYICGLCRHRLKRKAKAS